MEITAIMITRDAPEFRMDNFVFPVDDIMEVYAIASIIVQTPGQFRKTEFTLHGEGKSVVEVALIENEIKFTRFFFYENSSCSQFLTVMNLLKKHTYGYAFANNTITRDNILLPALKKVTI